MIRGSWLASLLFMFAATPAWCSELIGSFTGIAVNSTIFSTGGNLNGTPITGTFDFNPDSATITQQTVSAFAARYLGGVSSLTFTLDGVTEVVDSFAPSYASASGDFTANPQTLTINSQIAPGDVYLTGSLKLVGYNLFDPNDPTQLNAGSILLSQSGGSIFSHNDFSTDIQLTSVTFAPSPLPEPPALLLLGGITGAAVFLRRRTN